MANPSKAWCWSIPFLHRLECHTLQIQWLIVFNWMHLRQRFHSLLYLLQDTCGEVVSLFTTRHFSFQESRLLLAFRAANCPQSTVIVNHWVEVMRPQGLRSHGNVSRTYTLLWQEWSIVSSLSDECARMRCWSSYSCMLEKFTGLESFRQTCFGLAHVAWFKDKIYCSCYC